MEVSRRNFLKATGGSLLLGTLGINLHPARAYAQSLPIRYAKETQTICPY
jgi:formate dehydrogenase major subunit